MVTRILPASEYHRLGETDIPKILPMCAPNDVQVVVVERDGRIVGAWAAVRIVHLEGVWIAPEYRKRGTVAGRLLTATKAAARTWAPWAFTGADTKEVASLLHKHLAAIRIPMDTYAVSLE